MLSVYKRPLTSLFVIIQIASRRTELVFFSQNVVHRPTASESLVSLWILSIGLRQIALYLCDMGPRNGHFKTLLKESHVHKSPKHCLKPLVAPDGVTSELLGNEVQKHSLRFDWMAPPLRSLPNSLGMSLFTCVRGVLLANWELLMVGTRFIWVSVSSASHMPGTE